MVIAESIDVDDSSGSKANVALITNLYRLGFKLKVFHYTRKSISLKDIECIEVKEKRWSYLFFLSRLERYIRYYTGIRLNKPLEKLFGFSFTLFNDRNSILKAIKSNMNFDPDLIVTLSKGGSFRPHHALLKLPEWHSKWMAYMHDPYPMHHYPKPYTWFEPGYEKKENFVRAISEKAAFPAFPSLLLKKWMGEFYPGFQNKGIIIPHQIIYGFQISNDFPSYFKPDKFNLLHAGNLLGARKTKYLIEAYNNFLIRRPEGIKDSFLIFIGGNNNKLIDDTNKSNIVVSKEYISFDSVYSMQHMASVNIILEAISEISPFLPGKFPHCVKADRPILLLGPAKSEVRRIMGKEYPFYAESDDVESISKSIINLYDQWKKNPFQKLNREDLNQYLGIPNLKKQMDNLI